MMMRLIRLSKILYIQPDQKHAFCWEPFKNILSRSGKLSTPWGAHLRPWSPSGHQVVTIDILELICHCIRLCICLCHCHLMSSSFCFTTMYNMLGRHDSWMI